MATLTSNGSFSSLSISGNTSKSGSITWTPPKLPDGAIIQSTILTGTLTVSTIKGVWIHIYKNSYLQNSYSLSSRTDDISLSINLGTSLTSDLQVRVLGSDEGTICTVSMSNIVFTVNYVIGHIITASSDSNGSISESGEVQVENGNSKTFTFTPNAGYEISDVLVDGISVGAVSSYTFNNVTENHTISVSFKIIKLTSPVVYESSSNTFPSDNNFTKVGDTGKESITNGALHCVSGTGYIGYVTHDTTNTNSRIEVKFSLSSVNSGNTNGFRIQLSDGSKGVQVRILNDGTNNYYLNVNIGSTKTKVYKINSNEIYTIGIEYNADKSFGIVYVNDELVYAYNNNFATTSVYCNRNAIFIQGGCIVDIYSIKYYFDSYYPLIFIQSQDVSKISSISGKDRCTVSFISDQELQSWEARATLPNVTPSHGVGLLVESGTLSEGSTGYVYVDDEELTNGDANYTIAIYGQNSNGVWSDE